MTATGKWIKYAPRLEEYCTTLHQVAVLRAVAEAGSVTDAAEVLGVDRRNANRIVSQVKRRAAAAGYAPWAGLEVEVPEGLKVKGTSTLYGPDGEKKLQWVKTNEKLQEQYDAARAMVSALIDEIPQGAPVPLVEVSRREDLLSLYPIGDHHFGMFADSRVTGGEDYDLHRAYEVLRDVHASLVASAPSSGTALLMVLGDFLHYDSMHPVTPKHCNQLDSDGTPASMVHYATMALRFAVERCLHKHDYLCIMVVPGNHDPYSTLWLGTFLKQFYEHEPRVRVLNTFQQVLQVFEWGNTLIAGHHGDRIKPGLAGRVLAASFPGEWGRCSYRYIHQGHIHHRSLKEEHGVENESHGVLAPADAYAAGLGFASQKRSMQRIEYSREYGYVGRGIMTPEMVGL